MLTCLVSPAGSATFSNATSSFSGLGSLDFSSLTYTWIVSDPSTSPTLLIPMTISMELSAVRTRCLSSGRPYSKVV